MISKYTRFKARKDMLAYAGANTNNSKFADKVGLDYFKIENDNDCWYLVNLGTGKRETAFGMFIKDYELKFFEDMIDKLPTYNNPESPFHGLTKETAIVIHDIRVTRENYKEITKFITDAFEAE
ncbi:mRNA metabolism modulator [Serratia phage 92A1]|nr:mRNA metabolism modulator [Serratia phage 92A1]